MELDELKDIWKKNDAGFRPKNENELAVMLKGSSKSIIVKLKRSVWFELIFTLVSGLLLLAYAVTLPGGALKWTSVSILLLFVCYTVYYFKKLNLLNKFGKAEVNVRENLENLTSHLANYLKFYKRSYTILYPVYFCLALAFGAMERGLEQFMSVISQPRTLLYLAGLALIFYFSSTWFVNWYLKKLYGNHLEKLKSVLRELNSDLPPTP